MLWSWPTIRNETYNLENVQPPVLRILSYTVHQAERKVEPHIKDNNYSCNKSIRADPAAVHQV